MWSLRDLCGQLEEIARLPVRQSINWRWIIQASQLFSWNMMLTTPLPLDLDGGGQRIVEARRSLPLVMVDSGNQINNGYVNFGSVYSAMVDAALARPPKADIQAGWWRTGNKVGLYIQVLNLSGVSLSTTNAAALHVLIYEEAHVKTTSRFVRSTLIQEITLANNTTATYQVESAELTGVDWNKIHAVVLVDYRPGGTIGSYDMLQAVEAEQVPVAFGVLPEAPVFLIELSDLIDQQLTMTVLGPAFVNWTASENTDWFTLNPMSGSNSTKPILTALRGRLSPGWQQGSLTFVTADGMLTKQLNVSAYVGEVSKIFLPVLLR